MIESAPANLLHQVWEYPLFDALFGRRSRRFGLGFEMAEGPFKYKSRHDPLPLSEVEEAMLVAAGVGFSGMALWDQHRPLPFRAGDGGTSPARRAAVARRFSSPTIRVSTSLTLLRRPPASYAR